MDARSSHADGHRRDRAAKGNEALGGLLCRHAATAAAPLLVRAVALRGGPGDALDLGAGAGNEARYLLGLATG